MPESSRVSIRTVEHLGDGVYHASRSDEGSIGQVDIGGNLAGALMQAGGRIMAFLAEAAIEIDANRIEAYAGEPVEDFVSAAKKIVEFWRRHDNRDRQCHMAPQDAPNA